MHFLVIGATGRTGSLVVSEAIEKKHTITALARNPDSIPKQPELTVIKGSPLNVTDLQSAFSALKMDAVIITLSSSRASDSPFSASTSPPNFLEQCVINIVQVAKEFDVKKVVYMSAFGVGNSNPSLWLPMRHMINNSTMGKVGFMDHAEAEKALRECGLEWVVVRPVMLKEGGEKKISELGEVGRKAGYLPGITRQSVAKYLVKMAEIDDKVSKAVVICN